MLAWAGIAAARIIVIGNPNIKVDKLTVKQVSSFVIPQDGSGLFTQMPNTSQVFVYGAELDAIF